MTSLVSEPPQELAEYIGGRPWSEYRDEFDRVWCFRDEGRSRPGALPVVLLPGAMGNADVAWRIAAALREERRVISVTYPGDSSATELAQGLLGLLRSRGIGRIALWGSSYGAWWAQAFAAHYPERTAALWLGNTFVDADDVTGLSLFNPDWLESASTEDVIDRWNEAVLSRPDDLIRRVQLFMLNGGLAAAEFHARLRRVCRAQTLPACGSQIVVVVCNCDDDAIISARVRSRVHKRYPAARRVDLGAGGHYPHILVPSELLVEIRGWLGVSDAETV